MDGNGDCYEVHGNYITDLFLRKEKQRTVFRLCHGQVLGKTGDVDGLWFEHAWIEINGDVLLDFSNGNKIVTRVDALKDRIKAETVKRYTPEEASKLILKHEHYGPWEEEK